jgi:hypothetical protein
MKNTIVVLALTLLSLNVFASWGADSQAAKTAQQVARQQSIYAKSQPVPAFSYSLERDMIIQLYNLRNVKALTHSVWRSDLGTVEGDCASIGFGIPYDTSLTNPLTTTDEDQEGYEKGGALAVIEQAEPNGIFASKNTAATWVMCVGGAGTIEPIYVETKVTVYPYSVVVDYDKNRVRKTGKATVTIRR